jgi:putative transposase
MEPRSVGPLEIRGDPSAKIDFQLNLLYQVFMSRRRVSEQTLLPFRAWGGKRTGAGRKPGPGRKGLLPHVARPSHDSRHPVHVTMRARSGGPNLRAERVFKKVRRSLARLHRGGLRVTHFSVQRDHVHLIVEAPDKRGLARGLQGIASGIARAVNHLVRSSGRFWRERYHRRDLASPTQVRNAIVYVTMNFRKHEAHDESVLTVLDARSSAAWLLGWHPRAGPWVETLRRAALVREVALERPPVSRSATWLGSTGWKRRGLIAPNERPQSPS